MTSAKRDERPHRSRGNLNSCFLNCHPGKHPVLLGPHYESDKPVFDTGSLAIAGTGADQIVALDFRPVDGKLFGLGSGSRLFIISDADQNFRLDLNTGSIADGNGAAGVQPDTTALAYEAMRGRLLTVPRLGSLSAIAEPTQLLATVC